MKISKTDMLLLNNKIRKDEEDKNISNSVSPAPEQSEQKAMKALSFLGLKNLLSNPNLAQEVGVKAGKEYTQEDKEAAKSYVAPFSTNVSFKAGAKQIMAGVLAVSTLGSMTSCKDMVNVDGDKNIQITKVDQSALIALVDVYRATLDELKAQNQLSQFAWQQMINKLNDIEARIREGNDAASAFYREMFDQMVATQEGQNAIILAIENNHTQLVLNGQKIDSANEFLALLIEEVQSGKMDAKDAWNILKGLLQGIDNKLSGIIGLLEKAQQDREKLIDIAEEVRDGVGDIKKNTDKMIEQNDTVIAQNNRIIESNQNIHKAIDNLNIDMKQGINYVASVIGWSTTELTNHMKALGFSMAQVQMMTAGQIIAAIDHNTAVTEETNKQLKELNAEYKAGKITAKEYADRILGVLDEINANLKQGIIDFNTYADKSLTAQANLLVEAKKTNKSLDGLTKYAKDVIENQEKQYAMLILVNNNIKQLDADVIQSKEELAAKLGLEFSQLETLLINIGYTQAQIQAMTAQQIINAIKENTNATKQNGEAINNLGTKLDNIIKQLEKGELTAEEAARRIINLLGDIKELLTQALDKFDQYVQERKESDAALLAAVKEGNADRQTLINLTAKAIENQDREYGALMTVKSAIEEGVDGIKVQMSAGFKEVCRTLNINEGRLEGMLMALGYTQAQIMNMTAGQIVEAINNNTATIASLKTDLQSIMDDLEQGRISQAVANAQIIQLLGDIKELLTEALDKFDQYVQDRKNADDALLAAVKKGNADRATLLRLTQTAVANQQKELDALSTIRTAIRENTTSMNAGFKSVCQTLNINEAKLIGVLTTLGYTQAQIMNMNAGQIISAINENTQSIDSLKSKLQDIYNKLDNGIISQAEANAEIIKLLGDIKELLTEALDKFDQYVQDRKNADDALLAAVKKGNADRATLLRLTQTAVAKQQQELDALVTIRTAIQKNTTSMEAGFKSVCQTLNINEAKLIGVLTTLGYTQAQIMNMNAGQIISAINENTQSIDSLKSKLQDIYNKLDNGIISQAEANAEIIKLLGDIKAGIDELNANFKSFVDMCKQDMATLKQTTKNIEVNGKITNAKIDAFKGDVKNIANDMRKVVVTVNDVKNLIENGDGSTLSVDLSKIEDILTTINANQQMTKAEVLTKMNTYIQNQETIISMLDKQGDDVGDIKIFLQTRTNDNSGVIDAIKLYGDKIEAAVNNANTANINALGDLGTKIDELKALVQQFMNKFDAAVASWSTDRAAMLNKLTAIQNKLGNFDSYLNTIIVQGNTAEGQRKKIDDDILALKDALDNLNVIGGGSITVEQMDSLMSKHDHYNVYKPLLEAIKDKPGYDFSNMEKLLDDIKTGNSVYQRNAIAWLQEIVNDVKGLDKTSENYDPVLAEIRDLIKNWKCECNCGEDNSTNEGILSAAKKAMGKQDSADARTSSFSTVEEWAGAQKEAERDYAIRQAVNDALDARLFMTTARELAEQKAAEEKDALLANIDKKLNILEDAKRNAKNLAEVSEINKLQKPFWRLKANIEKENAKA